MTWRDFVHHYADTLGVAAFFALLGSGLLLFVGSDKVPLSRGRALTVLAAGQFVAAIATAFVHGVLGWSIFLAPFVGAVCGLVALPIILAVVKGGRRVEMRADDIADTALDKVGVKKGGDA